MATTSTTTAAVTPPPPISIDTQHEDLVHDAQLDYYGAKLATCSSDRTIKIYNVFENGSSELTATLTGHEGPIWQVSWAHPKFGVLLASCSLDGSVIIHKEQRPREWKTLYAGRQLHTSSVNAVSFAPHDYGLMLAPASSDGRVSLLELDEAQAWHVTYIQDCPSMGTSAVSWAPYGTFPDETGHEVPRLVTAGCDHAIRFWKQGEDGNWQEDDITVDTSLVSHSDWVRDVAWAPSLIPHHPLVASCSEDCTVLLWTLEENKNVWKAQLMHKFEAPVWRVSWSVTGHILAVSSGDNHVSLWKKGLEDDWTQVSTIADSPS